MKAFPSLRTGKRLARYLERQIDIIPFPSMREFETMLSWSYWRGYRTLHDVRLFYVSDDSELSFSPSLFDQRYRGDLLAGMPAYIDEESFLPGNAGKWVYMVNIPEVFAMRVKVTDVDDLPDNRSVSESYVVELPVEEYTEFDGELEREVRNGWESVKSFKALQDKISSAEYWFRKRVGLVYYSDRLAIVRDPGVVDAQEFSLLYRIE